MRIEAIKKTLRVNKATLGVPSPETDKDESMIDIASPVVRVEVSKFNLKNRGPEPFDPCTEQPNKMQVIIP